MDQSTESGSVVKVRCARVARSGGSSWREVCDGYGVWVTRRVRDGWLTRREASALIWSYFDAGRCVRQRRGGRS